MSVAVKSKTTSVTGTTRAADMVMRLTWERLVLEKDKRPTMRNSHAMTSIGQTVYLFGGRAKGGESNQMLTLDMEATSGDVITGRKSTAICSVASKGKLYVFGGCNKKDLLGDLLSYDCSLKVWSKESDCDVITGDISDEDSGSGAIHPCARDRHTLVHVKGKLVLFGGHSSSDDFLNDVWTYDIARGRWKLVWNESMHRKRTRRGDADAKEEEDDDDAGSGAALSRKNVPCPRYEHTAVSIKDKYMVIIGGKGKTSGLSDVHIFDVETSQWVTKEVGIKQIPRDPCWGQSACAFHERIIIFGGWNGRSCFNDIHVLDCSKQPWSFLDFQTYGERPSLRTFHASVAPVFVTDSTGAISSGSGGGATKAKKRRPAAEEDSSTGKSRSHFMVIMGGRDLKKRLDDTYTLDVADLDPLVFSKKRRRSLAISEDLTKTLTVTKPMSVLHADFKVLVKARRAASCAGSSGDADLPEDVPRIGVRDFELSTTLGTGSFGRVRLCRYKKSSEWFAMKMLRKTKVVEMKQENHIKWEKKILSSIRHPFIVNMEAFFQDLYFLYLVLELVPGGEFFSLLRKIRTLRMPHAVFYGAQIVLVFQYLHKNKIVYRDLKPENLLIASDGYLRLTDFGFAKKLDSPYRTWTLCGTPEYIAPEILLNRGHSFSVDWWALGILLFEMFTGNPPFVDDNPMRIYQKILDGKIDFPKSMPANAQDFIKRLLAKNLSARLGHTGNGAIDVMEHAFFDRVDWKRILDREVKSPYIPELKDVSDTRHFDPYPEDTDTEDTILDMDPFVGEF